MMTYRHIKKIISIVVICLMLFPMNNWLQGQSEEEIVRQFQRAKARYISGQYVNAKTRIERIISIIIEKDIPRPDILGGCYLLLGAIYEKEEMNTLAEENYHKAKDTYGMMKVEGVDLDPLPLYQKVVKREGIIEEPGEKKKKKFPWLLVVGGAVVLTAVYFLFLKPKKKQLTVNLGEGVEGEPGPGTYEYKKNEEVSYNYRLQDGYSQLRVLLDNRETSSQGTVKMDRSHTLTASAVPNEVNFVTDRDRVEVEEGGTTVLNVKLSAEPQNEINVTVSFLNGDSDISVLAGGNLVFTPSNWDTFQAVTLYAAQDSDAENGEATIRLSAPGIPEKDITAAEIDDDNLRFETDISSSIPIGEGGTVTFRVRLSAAPSTDITASVDRISGDSDITIQKGRTLTFTPARWNRYEEVTLKAAQDPDTSNGAAVIRISAPGVANKNITVTEIDDDILQFIIDASEPIEIDEGGTASFKVKLSAKPTSDVSAEVNHYSGDPDITVQSGSTLMFTPDNWNVQQTVTLAAAQDDDVQSDTAVIRINAPGLADRDIQVKELDDDGLQFVTDMNEITVPEEQTASFQVKLSAEPSFDVTASVSRASGDSDISVASNSTLTFTPANWGTYQPVTLRAAKDEDEDNGEATMRISAVSIPAKTITAREEDNGRGNPPEISISNPQDGAAICGDITIETVVYDDFGIKQVEFYIDNTLMETDTARPYTYVWPTAGVTPGPYQIRVIAYDAVDQTAVDEISITLEDDPPTVVLTPPDQAPASGTVTIGVHAEDCGGVQSIRIFVDDQPFTEWNSGPQTVVDWNFQLDTTAYTNGDHIIKAVAVDNSDQESQPAEITIYIEN